MNKMKEFFSRYSYDSVKMLVDQLVLSIFGFGLAMASVHAQNDTLLMITGVGSVIFYLTMLYSVAWKMGSSDRPTIETGNRKFNPLTGALVSLVANIPGLLMATIFMINSFLGNGGGFAGIIGRFINGMYLGLMTLIEFNGDHLHAYWWMYFLLVIPSVLACTVGYVMGVKSKLLAKLMTPQLPASDRPTRKELKERREEKKK